MSVSLAQENFTGGEWAPSLHSRSQHAKYGTACATMLNFFPHPHGGASNRSGFEYVAGTKTNSKISRVKRFQFNTEQAYMLEFGDLYIRVFYQGGGQVLNLGSPVEIVTPYVEDDIELLKFEQSNDTLYICHPSYAPRKLTRSSHTSWTLSTIAFGSSVTAPTGLSMLGTGRFFAVTAVDEFGNESVPSSSEEGAPSNTLSWTAVSGATDYNVYEVKDGTYQYVARTQTNSWVAPSTVTPDPDTSAPVERNPFSGANKYPSCVSFWKQRLGFAATNEKPQTFWLSCAADFQNMNISSPVQDDDSITATLNASQVNEIRWMQELKYLAIGTAGGEFRVFGGGSSESITPSSLDSEKVSDWGVSDVQPLIVGTSLLFVDASRKIVRDMFAAIDMQGNDGYSGNDLTILASHLFKRYGIKAWCYESGQESRIWCVLDNGTLAGMTYHKEHQIYGWHRHETDGVIESIDSIRSSDGTSEVWMIVKRTINGSTKRYVERMHSREFYDIEDAFFVDCGLTYDGSVSATLTPGTGATTQGTTGVTFTAGSSVFVSGDVGKFIYYRYFDDTDGVYKSAKAEITGYTSGTVVSCTIRLVFPSTSEIASGSWRKTVTTITGLDHLEGESVVALADGSVIDGLTVSSGSVTLSEPASKIHIGLQYTCDLETLGFVMQARYGTTQDRVKSIPSVVVRLEDARECFVGPDENKLSEIKFRTNENYGEPTRLFSGDKEIALNTPTQERAGRVFVRTVDPLPCTVQAIYPRITYGQK